MAKVTVTFEDVEDGVAVKVESDPPFGPPDGLADLTEAQQMGIQMTQMLAEQSAGDCCEHGGCGCHTS